MIVGEAVASGGYVVLVADAEMRFIAASDGACALLGYTREELVELTVPDIVIERLDDFLVVVEDVPDALGGVDDVVEVQLELLRQEAFDVPLEHAQRRALRLDDLAVADDLLLDVRDVAHDLFGASLEDVVLERVELEADLVEYREAVVEEVVEHLVQQAARALREELLAERLVLFAAAEEARERQQLDRRQGDEVVRPDEGVELRGVQPLDRAVVDREVENAEEVALVGVVVDLRPLALREDVLDVERVPAEPVGELLRVAERRRVEVDPGEAGRAELSGR